MLNENRKLINAYKALFQALVEPEFSNARLEDGSRWHNYVHHRFLYRAFLLEKILAHGRNAPADYWNFYQAYSNYKNKTCLYSDDFVNFMRLQDPTEKPLQVKFTQKAQEAIDTVNQLTRPLPSESTSGYDNILNASCLLLKIMDKFYFNESDIQTAILVLNETGSPAQVEKILSLTLTMTTIPAFSHLKDNLYSICNSIIEKTKINIQEETNLLQFLQNI